MYYFLPEDKNVTVLRRYEPNSRRILTGEQPDSFHLLQRRAILSRPINCYR